jgi:hypothetical protein
LHATSLRYAENFSESLSKANLVLTAQGEKKASKNDPLGWSNPSDVVLLDGKNDWPEFVAKKARNWCLKDCKQRRTI